jgi:hypothetical protein
MLRSLPLSGMTDPIINTIYVPHCYMPLFKVTHSGGLALIPVTEQYVHRIVATFI